MERSKKIGIETTQLGERRLECCVARSKDIFNICLCLGMRGVINHLKSLFFVCCVRALLSFCCLASETQKFDKSRISCFCRTAGRGKCFRISAESCINALVVAGVLDKGVFEGMG